MAEIKKYTKKNGETNFEFTVYTGIHPLTGKKSKTTRRGFRTKREATIELKRITAAVAEGTYFEIKDKTKLTFKDVYEQWREGYIKTVSESTLLKNDGMFNNRILPAFGNFLITSITSEMIQRQVNEWSHYKNASKWLDETSRVFTRARIAHILVANPCDLVTKPKVKKDIKNKKKEFYEKEELKLLVKEMDDWDNLQGKALLRLLAFTGIRMGEAMALTWNDIDFENKTLTIDKAIGRRKKKDEHNTNQKTKTELYLKDPKNYTSTRDVTLDSMTIEWLLEWKETNPFKLVFTSESGKWISPSKSRKWLLRCANKAGLDFIPVHNLRHTHASLLFESGATMKEVQDRLGHGDIKTTMNVYTHTTKASIDKSAERFSDYLDF
ncbi:tyrosine-type recombinase/integrase [Marinilactibacillus sp. GCM10026970]|uniref:site-specific integrase n=1 Tax=Marinilactibacillus sp. GCM10026970 TaxID=3252642 RepID=UPI003619B87A